MQFRQLLPLALASAISAQSSMSLTDALNSQNSTLSKLNSTCYWHHDTIHEKQHVLTLLI